MPCRRVTRGLGIRALALALITMVLSLVTSAPAAADPVDPADVPASLRQFVPDSAEWTASPWMTAAGCRDHGGDWSSYTAHLIKNFPALLGFFQPGFAGDDRNAARRKALLVQGYQDIARTLPVPSGYCVDQAKRWATPNTSYQPFGFEWGNVDNQGAHGVRPWSNCSIVDPGELAPCRGFYLSCDGAATQQADQRCQQWNTFSDRYVRRMNTVLRKAYNTYGVSADGGDQTKVVVKSPGEVAQEFLDWVTKKGMEQVVSFIVSGVTKLWTVFMRIAADYSAPQVTGVAFTSVYNLVAGVALALAFLGWLVTLAGSWKRGQLQTSLFGGIKAAAGVTLAGVGAILMLQLAHDCTISLIAAGGNLSSQANFTTSLAKANPLVAIIAGALIGVSLIFAIIFLVIDSALVLMWALFGAFAAAGQVHQASSGWLWKWAGRGSAMAWAPFFMVAVMLLSQALLLPLDPGENPVEQIVDVVQGLALCILLVLCPWLLWELVDFVGDRVGGAAASGGVAGSTASGGTRRGAQLARGAGGFAVRAMIASAREIGAGWREGAESAPAGGTHESSNGGRPAQPPPRPEAAHPQPAHRPGGHQQSAATHAPDDEAPVGLPIDARSAVGGGDGLPRPPANRGRVVGSALPRSSPSPPDTSTAAPPTPSPTPPSTPPPPMPRGRAGPHMPPPK